MKESVEAERLCWEAIVCIQPDQKLPSWLTLNATSYKNKLASGLWDVSIYIFKKRKLHASEIWEQLPDGSKVLVKVAPVSGEKKYVLHYTADEGDRIDLFRVEVDVTSKQTNIINAVCVADLVPETLEFFTKTLIADTDIYPLLSTCINYAYMLNSHLLGT